MRDAKIAIAWSEAGLGFLSWVHCTLIFAWILGAIIDGFNTGILHVAPAAYEVLVVKILADSLGFGPDGNTGLKERTIVMALFVLVIAIFFNIIHLVFTSIELGTCTSALCNGTAYWFLVTFLVLQVILIVFESIIVYFLIKYRWHVKALVFATNKK